MCTQIHAHQSANYKRAHPRSKCISSCSRNVALLFPVALASLSSPRSPSRVSRRHRLWLLTLRSTFVLLSCEVGCCKKCGCVCCCAHHRGLQASRTLTMLPRQWPWSPACNYFLLTGWPICVFEMSILTGRALTYMCINLVFLFFLFFCHAYALLAHGYNATSSYVRPFVAKKAIIIALTTITEERRDSNQRAKKFKVKDKRD